MKPLPVQLFGGLRKVEDFLVGYLTCDKLALIVSSASLSCDLILPAATAEMKAGEMKAGSSKERF